MSLERFTWAGLPVCVTGGTGFLGVHLVKQLAQAGARVTVHALEPWPNHPLFRIPNLNYCFGDITDPESVRRAVRDCAVIFHTAAIVAVWGPALARMHDVNVLGTRNVLDAAPANARIVHTSSIVTVGASRHRLPVTEATPFNLSHVDVPYIHSKRAAEELALTAAASGRDVVVTNPGYLVGPHDHLRSVMGRLCGRFWRARLLAATPGGFSLADVRDVAAGHLLAAQHGVSGRRYILGGANHTLHELLTMLAQVAGYSPRALPILPSWSQALLAGISELRSRLNGREPYPSFGHVRLNRYFWYANSDRAAAELGYRRRPLLESLRDTYEWFRSAAVIKLSKFSRWWLRPAPAQVAEPAIRLAG